MCEDSGFESESSIYATIEDTYVDRETVFNEKIKGYTG